MWTDHEWYKEFSEPLAGWERIFLPLFLLVVIPPIILIASIQELFRKDRA